MAAKILAFAGSLRKASFNKKLVHLTAKAASDSGAAITEIDLADYALPIFNEDLETTSGMPANGKALKALFAGHDGFIIGSPEYNGGITAALKNTIDWLSRPDGSNHQPFKDKWAALIAASPGALGGIRGLPNVRFILEGLGCIVIPEQIALNNASTAFSDDGGLVDEKQQQRLNHIARRLVYFIEKQKA